MIFLKAGDVIYLTRKVDESWLSGFCGMVEGMFPANFVNVVVPLPDEELEIAQGGGDTQLNYQPDYEDTQSQEYAQYYIQVLHDFEATEANDLTLRVIVTISNVELQYAEFWIYKIILFRILQEGDVVTVLGKINDDWLYGELHGSRGQFPTSFVGVTPADLPVIDLSSQRV